MPSELDSDAVVHFCDGFLWEVIEDGCLLFEEATGRMLTLNHLAELVLVHCSGEFTVRGMYAELGRLFDVSHDEAAAACQSLLEEGVIELRR